MKKDMPLLAVVVATATLLSACGAGGAPDGGEDYGSDAIAPAPAPDGWQVHELGPVSVSIPSGWTEADPPTTKDGAQAWAFTDGTPAEGENTNGVTVFVSPTADDDMLTQTENSMVTAERTLGAVDGSAEALTWPGASDAAFSTYFVTLPVGSEDGEKIRFESLGVATDGGEQAFVLVYGPDATFDAGGAHQVLESVKVS